MIRALLAPLMLVFSGPLLPLTHAQEATKIEGIIAIVNDDPISFTDVRARARMLLLSLGGAEPTPEQVQQLTSQALDQLIDEKLKLQEAAEYDLEVSDDEINNSLERLARQSGLTREGLTDTIMQAGINPVSLEDQTRADIAWQRIMNGLYGSRIRISDNQIQDQLNRLELAAEKDQYQLSEIFLFAPEIEMRDDAITAANSIREQILAGAPFQLAAQRFSSAPTAATGGDMGWVTIEDLDEARAAEIALMSGPGLTGPIQVDDGVYIMLLRNKREPVEKSVLLDITRLAALNGSRDALNTMLEQISSCDDIMDLAEADPNIDASIIEDLDINNLSEEAGQIFVNMPIDTYTDVLSLNGSASVTYLCAKSDFSGNLPGRDQIEDQLFAQQLSMVSNRSLRNLRREATIIRR